MVVDVKVEIGRTCMSLLFKENSLSYGPQEGFLLGTVQKEKSQSANDDAAQSESVTTVIRITSFMAVNKPPSFCNAAGQLKVTKLKELLGECQNITNMSAATPSNEHRETPLNDDGFVIKGKVVQLPVAYAILESVIGYYDFMRNIPQECSTLPSFQTRLLFNDLCHWRNQSPMGPNPMALLVIREIHKYNTTVDKTCCFWTNIDRNFEKVVSRVLNLGETSQKYYSKPPVPGVDEIISIEFPSQNRLKIDDLPAVKAHTHLIAEVKKVCNDLDVDENAKTRVFLQLNKLRKGVEELAANQRVPQVNSTT